jgi:hypothetical protein
MWHAPLCTRWTLGLTVPKHGPIFERLWCLTSFLQEACIMYLSWWSRPQTTEVHYEYADRMEMNVTFAIFVLFLKTSEREIPERTLELYCARLSCHTDVLRADFPLHVSICVAMLAELTRIKLHAVIHKIWITNKCTSMFMMGFVHNVLTSVCRGYYCRLQGDITRMWLAVSPSLRNN